MITVLFQQVVKTIREVALYVVLNVLIVYFDQNHLVYSKYIGIKLETYTVGKS